ncbi:hypothetical protein [Azospirillum argentinense]
MGRKSPWQPFLKSIFEKADAVLTCVWVCGSLSMERQSPCLAAGGSGSFR